MIISLSLNAQLIYQRFGHAFHQIILQIAKLGIYTGLPKSIPKLYHPCCTCIMSKGLRLPFHPNLSTENLDPGTHFHLDLSFFNKVSCQIFNLALIIVDATTSHMFSYPNRSKCLSLILIKTFIQFSLNHGYKISIFWVDEGGDG